MTYPKDGKPRIRELPNGWWQLTPPQPLWPDYYETYVSASPTKAYEMWLKDLHAPMEYARQESLHRARRSLS